MPHFIYKGRNDQGQLVNGEMDAANAESVAGQLSNLGLIPVSLTEVNDKDTAVEDVLEKFGRRKISTAELIMFCRQMYTITKAGIPLIRGVRGLAASINHPQLRKTLNDVAESLESGVGLSVAMGKHPTVFNSLFISIVKVGENSGRLDEAFDQLSEYLERDMTTNKRIKAALRYPTFVIMAIAAAIAVINIKVIPEFSKMFDKFDAELPIATVILITTSKFSVEYWPYILAVMVVAFVAWKQYLKTENGQRFWGEKKLNIPIIGDIIERGSMARYTRSFSLMMRSGVPLPTSLELCARVIDNLFLSEKIRNIRTGIERGESLLRTHSSSGMFTPLVLQMIAVGEESGQVDELLSEVASYYEREVDYDVESLSAKIEPLLIVVMAAVVLVLALGIFLPMWGMYDIQK
ncbi:MAG: type II secretion system F family protein [Cellvibrionaceae bacterium]